MEIGDIKSTTTLSNGVQMPVLGLGVYKAKDGKEVINSVQHGLNAGYRLFDTASFYKNEEGVGQAIKDSGVLREEIFVTTKVWNDDQGFQQTLKAFDVSRKKLDLDVIDLYLVHWPVPGKYIDTWRALEKLYQEGKVKAIGVCNCLEHHLMEIINVGNIKPMLLQNEFHPHLIQQSILDYCERNEIQYQAWAPLMRGRILDNPVLKELAEKHGKTVAQVIIRWDLQKGVATIPKSVHKSRIAENADVFDFSLAEDDLRQIDSLDRDQRTGAHPDDFLDHFKGK